MKQTCLYGTRSRGSFEVVTTGLERALKAHGALAGVARLDKEEEAPAGGAAPRAIVVGNPFCTKLVHFRGMHDEVWLLLAPNSEGVPEDIIEDLTLPIFSLSKQKEVPTLTGLLAPSRWAQGVLQRCFPKLPVRHVPHGVLSEFRAIPEARQATLKDFQDKGEFRCLHATSTDRGRKGTKELLQAWGKVELQVPRAQLLVTCQPPLIPILQDYAIKQGCRRVQFTQNHFFTRELWVAGLAQVHCVIQPSRGEGFGLVPLEAMACGVPVVATACTGHSEYMPSVDMKTNGVETVPHGDLADCDDYAGSKAPTVTSGDIEQAILKLHAGYARHHEGALECAPHIREHSAWETVTKKGLDE
jgi:glycosyltransferase involved in cell wall biosynthesis